MDPRTTPVVTTPAAGVPGPRSGGGTPLARQRLFSTVVIAVVALASVVTGGIWRVSVDHGGETAGNPISRYAPHWLYPTLAATVVIVLLVMLLRRLHRPSTLVGLTAIAAGGAANVAEWLILGGVSNPFGPVPGIHGSGQLSVGDLCLWIGAITLVGAALRDGSGSRRRS